MKTYEISEFFLTLLSPTNLRIRFANPLNQIRRHRDLILLIPPLDVPFCTFKWIKVVGLNKIHWYLLKNCIFCWIMCWGTMYKNFYWNCISFFDSSLV